jgi:hypothetical protein
MMLSRAWNRWSNSKLHCMKLTAERGLLRCLISTSPAFSVPTVPLAPAAKPPIKHDLGRQISTNYLQIGDNCSHARF